jgi:hypothetical protein
MGDFEQRTAMVEAQIAMKVTSETTLYLNASELPTHYRRWY